MHFRRETPRILSFALIVIAWMAIPLRVHIAAAQNQAPSPSVAPRAVLDKYCISCHNQKLRTAGLELDSLDVAHPSTNPEIWERVIGKLRAASMPPPGNPRP